MGLPQADLPQFLRWRDDTIRPQPDETGNEEEKREAAGKAISDYFGRTMFAPSEAPVTGFKRFASVHGSSAKRRIKKILSRNRRV